jgi:hypothetical protein
MKEIYLDSLPKWEEGRYKGKIKWVDCIGSIVNFQYNTIKGNLEILDYDIHKLELTIRYKNKIKKMLRTQFTKCKLGDLLGEHTKEYKFKVGEILNNLKSGQLKIIERIRMDYKESVKGYKYECLECNNVDIISESGLKEKKGCNVCSNRKIRKGYNDLWSTRPDIAKLLTDKNDGYRLNEFSNKIAFFSCPNCKQRINKDVSNVSIRGLCCSFCSDGISYPEKFFTKLLLQLEVKFFKEKTFDWSKNIKCENIQLNGTKRYDFYFPIFNCIIEIHGGQHYQENKNNNRNLKLEKENDCIKKELALINGINNYIVIDCRKSDLEYIKNNIINSPISNLFNLKTIDWERCHKFACSSLVKKACDIWNEGVQNVTLIALELNLTSVTIRKYLKQGRLIGWCNYDEKDAMRKNGQMALGRKYKNRKGRSVVQLDLSNNYIDGFSSISQASEKTKISLSHIQNVCSDRRKSAGGFKWMYKEDYEEYIKQAN